MPGGQRTVKIKFDGESSGVGRAAKSAERAVKQFGDNVRKQTEGLGSKVASGLSGLIEGLPPMGKLVAGVIGAGLAAALAPVVGAAITSAVLLGVGGAALAVGIKAAMKSPAVQAAFEPLKETARNISNTFGAPFRGPLVRAAETFNKALKAAQPVIDRIGRAVGPLVDDLAPALAGFMEGALPGIESAVKASVPLFQMLADKLPGLGDDIGRFFEEIGKGGPGATRFLGDFLEVLGKVIVGIGIGIGKLSSWYLTIRKFVTDSAMRFLEFRVKVINEFGRILDGAAAAFSWVPGVGPKLKKAQQEFSRFRAEANRELAAIKDRKVRVEAYSNVGAAARSVARQLAAIRDEKVYISVSSNVGQVVAGISKQVGKVAGKRASGGPVAAGRSYLVGERGPEVLTMGGNGTVTPNRDLGGDTIFEVTIQLADEVAKVLRLNSRDLRRRATMRGAVA